jgi:hypothetical protein
MTGTRVKADPAPGRTGHPRGALGLVRTGLLATLAAMLATTLAAAVAQALGVDFEVPEGGESIPLSGIAVVTGLFSGLGTVIAAALLRWSAHPVERFWWTAVSLTVVSLVPPLVSGAVATTASALVVLHLVAAAVVVPVLARSLRDRGQGSSGGSESEGTT